MKNTICCLLVMGMLLTLACAAAEAVPSMTLDGLVEINSLTGTISFRKKGSKFFQLMTPEGEILVPASEGYTSMGSIYGRFPVFKVEKNSADGIHKEGLIDSAGRVLVPAEYADVKTVSERWQVGITLVPSTADVKDYTFTNWSSSEKKYYQIKAADFFFDGRKVGTLDRDQYGGSSPQAHGAYIAVTDRKGKPVFYDSSMTASPYDSSSGYSEYDQIYENKKNTYYHLGTGQVAFADSCTLDPADLEKDFLYDHGVVYDIRGNELFKTEHAYDSVFAYKSDYALVRMRTLYGLIDRNGKEILPVEYSDIGYSDMEYFKYGYVSAVKDEKFGFVDVHGNVTCDFVYAENVVRNYGLFGEIKNLDGTIIVLSAGAGELPEHYQEVEFIYGGCAFIGTDREGRKTVVDLYGNTLLPYTDAYRSIDMDKDASLIVGLRKDMQRYDIYTFPARDTAGASLVPSPSGDTADASMIPIPSLDDVFVPADPIPEITALPLPAPEGGTWTCSSGHEGNTGKFCAQCGLPKPEPTPAPAQDGTWTCVNGHAGNTGKFCSECGAPKPADEDEAWTCVNGHAGNTGNFCAQCGAPKPGKAGAAQQAEPDAPEAAQQAESAEQSAEPEKKEPEYDNPFPQGFERFNVPFAGTFIDHQIALEQLISFAEPGSEAEVFLKGSGTASEKLCWTMYENSMVRLYILYHPNGSDVYAYALTCTLPVSSRTEWAAGSLQPDQRNVIGSILWVESGEDNDQYALLMEKGAKEIDADTARKLLRNPDLNASCLWFSHRLTYFRESVDASADRYWVIFHNTPDQ